MEIADNGTITDEFIDFGELGVFNCYEPDFIHISGDIYAIAYRGFNDGGYLKTVEITDNGSINNSFVDSFEFEASYCFEPNITHVTGNVYVIVYKGYDEYGILKIVNITDEGNISDSVNDEIEIDTSYCSAPKIIPVNWSVPNNKGVYAIVYEGATGGILKTAEIYGNGSINHSFSDYIQYPKHRLEFDTDECHKPDIIRVNGSFYAIAYGSVASEVGILKTVEILNNGSINQSIINTSEYHQGYCDNPDIIHVNNSVYAFVSSAS